MKRGPTYRHEFEKNQEYVEKENERYGKIPKRYTEKTEVGKYLNDSRIWISYVLSPYNSRTKGRKRSERTLTL